MSQPPSSSPSPSSGSVPAAPSPGLAPLEAGEKPPGNGSIRFLIVASVLLLALLGAGTYYFLTSGYAETDDAYTQADVHDVSARVAGTVEQVLVNDNQWVNAGDILVRLDPSDFKVQLERAQANYDQAKADYARVQEFRQDVAISKQDYDQSYATFRVMDAALQDAKNQLSYCTIRAPTGGYVGNRSVEEGNRVQVGGALLSIVTNVWVVANFKETQIGPIRRGQHVRILVDAFPDHPFTGYVESLAPGTGATFALLPPDNATGNFTKIVQRVPVKILFDPESLKNLQGALVPGLSCQPSIDLRTAPASNLPAVP